MNALTADQVAEWEAYDVLDPIGTWREDFRMGQICNTIIMALHSIFAAKGSKHELSAWDFIPKYGEEAQKKKDMPKKQSIEEMKATIFSIAGAAGKRKREHAHG